MKIRTAISASLVDMRNVGAHKSLKLTLHVPEELAMQAIEIFGWPTGAAPVSVALARLADGAADTTAPREADNHAAEARQRDAASRPRSLAWQAGICCRDPIFWRFLTDIGAYAEGPIHDEASAADAVRLNCGATSRSQFTPGSKLAERWRALHSQFLVWRDNPDLGTAA